MRDDDADSPELWDEYQWERFLQQQDRKTEKYFTLLERYIDDPRRDEIIAREMGWSGGDDLADPDVLEAIEASGYDEGDCDEDDGEFDHFRRSPVYRDTVRLNRYINTLLDRDPSLQENHDAVELATRSAICGAKLAAALCGDELAEVGMTIAYLKRGLKAANDALTAGARLNEHGLIGARQRVALNRHLFRLRDRIVDLMSEYRSEWRRRGGY